MLEGLDREWIQTDANRRFATYTRLEPGEYTFRVKGSNMDGVWGEERTLSLTIRSAPWLTLPARLFYLLLLVGLGWLIWRLFERIGAIGHRGDHRSGALHYLSRATP